LGDWSFDELGLRIQWSVNMPLPGISRRGMWHPMQFAAGETGHAFLCSPNAWHLRQADS
jgi:hypothetical protein